MGIPPKIVEYQGKALSIRAWGRELGLPACTISKRLRLGWPLTEVFRTERPSAEARFWSHVRRTRGCWLWLGTIDSDGYGLFAQEHRLTVLAHRFAWTLAHGIIPDETCVLHTCDRRHCVRPDHLYLGTPARNSRDMVERGRSLRGEDAPNAKLTNEQVAAINKRYNEGEDGVNDLAEEYGVSRCQIWRIGRHGIRSAT